MKDSLYLKSFPVGPLQCNCTIIGDKKTGHALIVDPGGDAQKILELLEQENFNAVEVIHTHAHFDHFLASGEIKKKKGAKLGLHKDDHMLWSHLEDQCQMFGMPFNPVPDPDHWLEDQQEIYLGSRRCGTALHTPGHTPGSMSFLFSDLKLLIAGDTLFNRGIGRTDLWGGDYSLIEKSIKNVIYKLDEQLEVITGHGPSTRIVDEMRENPFIKAG